MKWIKELPKNGDTKIVKKFAFFPTRVGSCVIWLEFYNSYQMYRVIGSRFLNTWEEWWEETERRLL